MAGSAEPALGPRGLPWRTLVIALAMSLLGLVAHSAGAVLGTPAILVGLLVMVLGGSLIGAYWPQAAAGPAFGAANTVTLLRVVGTSWAAALAAESLLAGLTATGRLLLVVIGSLCLLLDGIDGRVARARNEVSVFGARFDMETDAALLLFLSVTVPALGIAGWWVVTIGAMRYLYVAASRVLPALRVPLDIRYLRKVVAVVQGVALLAALLLDLLAAPLWLPTSLLILALAWLCWSFGRDVAWQVRHR